MNVFLIQGCQHAAAPSLAHDGAAPSVLHLEALGDGLDGSPGALLCDRLSWHRVVDVRGDVELQQLRELLDDVLRRAALLHAPQPDVGFDDLRQLVRQVVLGPVRCHMICG